MCKDFSILAVIIALGLLSFQQACVMKEIPVTETYEDVEYRTEFRTETYSEVERSVVQVKVDKKTLNPVVKWFNSLYYVEYKPIRATYYYGYFVGQSPYSKSKVVIHLSRGVRLFDGVVKVYDLTGIGQIPAQPTSFSQWGYVITPEQAMWVSDLNYVLGAARQLGQVTMGPEAPDSIEFDARGVWEFAIMSNSHLDHAISYVELQSYEERVEEKVVTKQRQVPQQVPYKVQKQRTIIETKRVPFWELFSSE